MIEQLIAEFRQKATHDKLLESNLYANDILNLYSRVLQELQVDYDVYRKNIARFLGTLEEMDVTAISIGIKVFLDLEPTVTGKKNLLSPDNSFIDVQLDDVAIKKLEKSLSESLSQDNKVSIHNFKINIDTFSVDELKSLAAFFVRKLQYDAANPKWAIADVQDWIMHLAVLRRVFLKLNNVEAFYHSTGIFLDRLASSDFFQIGRDVCEELLISSFIDSVSELGFFNSFRFYSITKNAQAALVYANITLGITLNKEPVSNRFIREIVWQSMKMFRGINLPMFAIQVYARSPNLVFSSDYEKHSLDHTYFTILLSIKDPGLPYEIYDYLNKERESILSGDEHEATPWLVTLYNIKRLYESNKDQIQLLEQYIRILEHIVPQEVSRRYKSIVQGTTNELKLYLLDSLDKLYYTRNVQDFVYDNDSAITLSGRLIPSCVEENDAGGFLLAMVARSDYSILFQPKETAPTAPVMPLPNDDGEIIYKKYVDKAKLPSVFKLKQDEEITWLSLVEGKLYQLFLTNDVFHFCKSSAWINSVYREAINSDLFANLIFDDVTKDKQGGVRQVYYEEHEQAEVDLAKKLSFAQIDTHPSSFAHFVIKDMELAKYPHNLFINRSGQFIHRTKAVANIISSEWFAENGGQHKLSTNYSKSVWIPVQSSDFALNYLYSGIESSLRDNQFNIFEELELAAPINADINIVCSHGASNISEIQIVSQRIPGDNPNESVEHFTFNLDSIVGSGKILIFFVCHSGSMRLDFFKNNISSLVKRYLSEGYGAVIAPAWALHVFVPKIWLPVFLHNMSDGQDINTSVFEANKAVYKVFPTPAAWACLHLYGDPYLTFNK